MAQGIKTRKGNFRFLQQIIDLSVESFIDDPVYAVLGKNEKSRINKLRQLFLRALYLTDVYGEIYMKFNFHNKIVACLLVLHWNRLFQNKHDYNLIFNPPGFKRGSFDFIEEFILSNFEGKHILYPLYVAVNRDYRSMNLATELIAESSEMIRENTVIVTDISDFTNQESLGLCKKAGIEITCTGNYPIAYKVMGK